MTTSTSAQNKPSTWQIALGAEGIAAAQFARCGFDVSVQSGRDKPWYELAVSKAGNLLKVSVKGSDDGRWDLTQSYLKRAADMSGKKSNCQGAIDLWLDHLGSRAMCCLVQFQGVPLDELPRLYLAAPQEVAQRMREIADRLGDSVLQEKYEWGGVGGGLGKIEGLPSSWRFSEQRIQDLLIGRLTEPKLQPLAPPVLPNGALWPAASEASRNNPLGIAARA
jgi:hypothetical protein